MIQIVGAVNEPLSLPDWLDTVVIVLLAVGFPIAIVLAWAFELTPQGIRPAAEIQTGEFGPRLAGQPLYYVAHVLVLLAVGFLVMDQYLLTPQSTLVGSQAPGVATPVVSRTTIPLSMALSADVDPAVAISADGTRIIAYVVDADAGPALYLRRLDSFEAVALPGTENGRLPFFSPDGREVGFWADGKLKKVAIDGGTPVEITDAPIGYRGASWGPDDVIILGGNNMGLQQVSAVGGDTLTPITMIDPTANEDYHAWPQVLQAERP